MTLFYRLLGALLILAGLPLFWTPIPVGAVLILIGMALVVANSTHARNWLHRRRSQNPGLDKWMTKSEKYLPHPFARILQQTSGHKK